MDDIKHRKYLESKNPLQLEMQEETVNSLTSVRCRHSADTASWHYTGPWAITFPKRSPHKRGPPTGQLLFIIPLILIVAGASESI